ncbi:MAG: amidohydrolase family protein [Dehalococcoidia bacterium]
MRIDAHAHVFPPGLASTGRGHYLELDLTYRTLYADPRAPLSTAEALLDSMDQCGIDKTFLVNIGWATHELCRETNDYILDAARRHPRRFVAFCSVNPLAGKEAVGEIERCAALGARGLGELHPDSQGYDLADPHVMGPIVQAAARRDMVILTHASEPVGHLYPGKGQVTPRALYQFITNFPDQPIICAHWGGGLPFYALMPEVRRALKNVVFDTAASPFLYEPAVFETVAGLVGPEKILLGTDYPLIKQERLLRQVQESSLSAQAQELVLGGNAARLLGLG